MLESDLDSVINRIDSVVLGSGPAGLAAALSLIKNGKKTLIIDQGLNSQNFFSTESINFIDKPVGGIGGVAKIWGGQCGTFTEKDESDWKNCVSNETWTKLESGLATVADFLNIPISKYNRYSHLDVGFRKIIDAYGELELLHTVYAPYLEFETLFASLLKSDMLFLYEDTIVNLSTKEFDQVHEVVLQSGKVLDVRSKIVIIATGTIPTTRFIGNCFPTSVEITPEILDHPQAYVIEVFGRLPWAFRKNALIQSKGYRFKRKIVFRKKNRECIFEIHAIIGSGRKELRQKFAFKEAILFVHYLLNYFGMKIFRRPLTSECTYLIWIQIDQIRKSPRKADESAINSELSWSIDPSDLEFIQNATDQFADFLRVHGIRDFRIFSRSDIESSIIHSYHPSSTMELSNRNIGTLVNQLGLLSEKSNFAITSAAIFPFAGWINPTLIIMGFAYASAENLISRMESQIPLPPQY